MDAPRRHIEVRKDHPLGALALYVQAKEREASEKDAVIRALQKALAEKNATLERTKVAAVVALQWLSFSMDTLQRDYNLLRKQANQDQKEHQDAIEATTAEQEKHKARSLELLVEKEHLEAVNAGCLRELDAERETNAHLRAKINELGGEGHRADGRLAALDAWVASESTGIERAMTKLAKIKSGQEQRKEIVVNEYQVGNRKDGSKIDCTTAKPASSSTTKRQRPLLTTKRNQEKKQNGKEKPAPKRLRVEKQNSMAAIQVDKDVLVVNEDDAKHQFELADEEPRLFFHRAGHTRCLHE